MRSAFLLYLPAVFFGICLHRFLSHAPEIPLPLGEGSSRGTEAADTIADFRGRHEKGIHMSN